MLLLHLQKKSVSYKFFNILLIFEASYFSFFLISLKSIIVFSEILLFPNISIFVITSARALEIIKI